MSDRHQRIYGLDYIKAICIIMVIIMHTEIYQYYGTRILGPFYIDLAVPFFMMVSGITLSIRFEKYKESLQKYWSDLPKNILLLAIPYTICIAFIVITKSVANKSIISIFEFLRRYFLGTLGTGGYFITVYIELLFMFPVIYRLIHKKGKIGVLITVFLNIVFETLNCYFVDNGFEVYELYKANIFRYLSFVAVGIYIYMKKDYHIRKIDYAALLMGGVHPCLRIFGLETIRNQILASFSLLCGSICLSYCETSYA